VSERDPSWWTTEEGGEPRARSPAWIDLALREGRMTGDERVRPPAADHWVRLRDTALFRAALPAARARARQAARTRVIFALVHLLTWFSVAVVLTKGKPLSLAFGWGLLLIVDLARSLPALRTLLRRAPEPPALEVSTPFAAEVRAAVHALEGSAGAGADLPGLLAAALALEQRRLALEQLCAPLADVRAARAAAVARLDAAAGDPDSEDAFSAELRAIDERLGSMEAAATVAAQLAARGRALLHQLEDLRLQLAQARVPEAADLAQEAARLRDELRASGEVDHSLARARAARRASGVAPGGPGPA